MGTPVIDREPCPDRILDDVGHAFVFGAVGGSAFHYLKGVYNSPTGSRFLGGSQAVRMNAPRVAGSFAVWCGLFSAFDCTTVYARQKEDPWNSIIAGAATGGFLQMRKGVRASARSALVSGLLLGLMEGVGFMLDRVLPDEENTRGMIEDPGPGLGLGLPMGFPGQTGNEVGSSSDSGWFAGGKKKEESRSGRAKNGDFGKF